MPIGLNKDRSSKATRQVKDRQISRNKQFFSSPGFVFVLRAEVEAIFDYSSPDEHSRQPFCVFPLKTSLKLVFIEYYYMQYYLHLVILKATRIPKIFWRTGDEAAQGKKLGLKKIYAYAGLFCLITLIALAMILLVPKHGQPLPGILDFGPAGVGVFPEVEEFGVVLYGFLFLPLLFIDLPQHVETLSKYVSI